MKKDSIWVPNVASTHPQKDKTFADLMKHKAIEFVVEAPAKTLKKS